MSNYFDNQDKWSWEIHDGKATVVTNHGNHTHTLDVTDVPVGEMVNNTGQVMGDAHRASSHDPIVENEEMTSTGNTVSSENGTLGNSIQSDVNADISVGLDTESGSVAEDSVESGPEVDFDDGIDM